MINLIAGLIIVAILSAIFYSNPFGSGGSGPVTVEDALEEANKQVYGETPISPTPTPPPTKGI